MRIIFFGTPTFSVPILEALSQKEDVVLVVTQPDTYDRKKKTMRVSPVKEKALALGLKVFQPERVKNNVPDILVYNPDIIITAAYGQILPKILLETPPLKAINVHASLLPKLRGGAPIQRAIERMHLTTGVTIMQMVPKMDAGPIIAQSEIPIETDETSETLFVKLSQLGKNLLIETLPIIKSQSITPKPQDPKEVTYAYALKREEERLDFSLTAKQLDAKIRAFYPSPNTYTQIQGNTVKIIKASYTMQLSEAKTLPGTIVEINDEAITVQTQRGLLHIKMLQLPGKKPMPVHAFMHGKGKSMIQVMDQFN